MAIEILTGKPGSGKSYHAVSAIVSQLRDYGNYEMKKKKVFGRKIFTNLPLDMKAINEYLNRDFKTKFDYSHYVEFIKPEHVHEFWKHIEPNCHIYLDEAQLAFGVNYEDADELNKRLSIHRHEGQDIMLITQHVELMHKSVLCTTERFMDVLNIKATRIPFLNIPFDDVHVVLESFGFKNQTYILSYGIVKGRAIKWTEGSQSFIMNKDIYALYNSHSKEGGVGGASGDRPSLELGRTKSLLWFVDRHYKHICFKLILIAFAVCTFLYLAYKTPETLIKGSLVMNKNNPSSKTSKGGNVTKGRHSSISRKKSVVPVAQLLSDNEKMKKVIVDKDLEIEVLKDKVKNLVTSNEIRGVFLNGVILANGQRFDVGEELSFDGETKITIISVDHVKGVIVISDGRKLRVR